MRTICQRIALYFVPIVLLFAVGGAVPAGATPSVCLSDIQGANDQPGQKDLTGFCSGSTSELSCSVGDFGVTWNWDDTALSGGNTGDACGLFDTDDDGNANFALCVTISGSPASQLSGVSPRLYSCGNTRPDRCTSPIAQITSFTSTCTVTNPASSPFTSSGNSGCKGTQCGSKDTQAKCCVELNDFSAAGAAVLLDTCSYPSQQPNSDPSDCIVTRQCSTDADCSSGHQVCHLDQCGTDGICRHPVDDGGPCDDGNACTTNDTCSSDGTCGAGSPTTCQPLDQCHDAGQCNTTTGVCSNPPKANGSGCVDGDSCTINDVCTNGVCGGTAIVCTALDQCHDIGTCSGGACSNPPKTDTTPCNDGNACTTGDNCVAGDCTGAPIVCTAKDQCHIAGTCVGGTCTDPNKPNGTSCSDNNICTDPDTCQDGVCVPGGPQSIPPTS